MFEWDKSTEQLNVSAKRVLRLYRSLGDIQVALPGLPLQKSSVYLCAYAGIKGGQVVVVFHLLSDRKLAIYRHNQREVSPVKMKGLLDEGSRFAESLGFVLDAVAFQQMSPQEKLDFWNDLPLFHGTDSGLVGDASSGAFLQAASSTLPNSEELHDRRRFLVAKLGRFLATF